MIAENLKIVTIKIDFFISINIIPFLCLQKGFSNDSKKKIDPNITIHDKKSNM